MDREILSRYIDGNVTDKEVEIVVNWLDESNEHVREYMRLHKLHDLTLFNQTDNSSDQKLKKRSLKPYKKIAYELFKVESTPTTPLYFYKFHSLFFTADSS